ncbi:hypothetical protein ADIWIN_1462 [Winogradskyella psychrotolerans RS-3]|uniref:Uncharacterized protein n=1 Tax=Winogradskyella psychrotolerans RS-3 TaxID=641526 RepID=S7VVL3_9FLAO|nr:hypothetical protein [Winogradskyella psychrotolerans]EPR73432.1 hypothetical protein ADIWIN_1462 [Winogradskyella psychrotolerans RS-3]
MDENFDQFPVNFGETSGRIERNSFQFNYKRFEVWQGGKCIHSGESKSEINAKIVEGNLVVYINDEKINHHIIKRFSFGQISTSGNRIMWSNDIFNTSGLAEYNKPDVSSLFYKNGKLVKVTYTIHNPNTLVEFYVDENASISKVDNSNISKLDVLSKKIVDLYDQQMFSESREYLVQLFLNVKRSPESLKEVNDFESLGRAYLFMLDQKITDDIDNLQMISSLGYLFLSKAHSISPTNANLIMFRLMVLQMGLDALKYTVMSILEGNGSSMLSMFSGMQDIKARDAIYKMEISDIDDNPIIYMRVDYFNERKVQLDEMVNDDFFLPLKTKQEIKESGIKYHKKLYEYLVNKVLMEFDIDF